MTGEALTVWRRQLAGWEIPPEILAKAPEPPWGFPVELFRAPTEPTATVSRSRAADVLPPGGVVLDVGCGGGAAAMALAPPAGGVVGVDESADLLAAFEAAAAERGVDHRVVRGTWPQVAPSVEPADVVVCHHVLYNVSDLPPFVSALTNHARRRVVCELTERHPLVESAELWRQFHGIDRPAGPTADLAADVLRDLGVPVTVEVALLPARDAPRDAFVRLNRRRLCLPASAEPAIDRVMGPTDQPRRVVTLWWDVDDGRR